MQTFTFFVRILLGLILVVGIALLTGYFTPLALLILLPISVNILLFRTYLAPPMVGPGLFIFSDDCLYNSFIQRTLH